MWDSVLAPCDQHLCLSNAIHLSPLVTVGIGTLLSALIIACEGYDCATVPNQSTKHCLKSDIPIVLHWLTSDRRQVHVLHFRYHLTLLLTLLVTFDPKCSERVLSKYVGSMVFGIGCAWAHRK